MDITALARLAKLDLTPEEEAKLHSQLTTIIDQFSSLSELPPVPLSIDATRDSHLRTDVVVSTANAIQNALLDASKHKQANFIRLPSVF